MLHVVNNTEVKTEFINDNLPKICLYTSIKNQTWQAAFSMLLSFLTERSE